jgi:hypothetical protein
MLAVLKVCHIFSGDLFNWFWQFNGYSPKLQRGSIEDVSSTQSWSYLKVGHIFSGNGFQLAFSQFKHSLPELQKDHSRLLVLRVCNSGNVFNCFPQFNGFT